MRTIDKITTWQGQQILKIELDRLNEPLRRNDVRLWNRLEYMFIKSRVMELFNNTDPLTTENDILKTPKRKYKINYNVEFISDNEKEQIISFCEDWLTNINNLHYIVAAIAEPVKVGFHLVSPLPLTLEQQASDISNAKFIDVFSIVQRLYKTVERASLSYRIERLKNKVCGKPEPVRLIETTHGIMVTT